ncbi:MAG: hypothetical protein SOX13_02035 [Sodaliphilus sp.]|nr:hypothetical protein [Sodaliphilus sp.]
MATKLQNDAIEPIVNDTELPLSEQFAQFIGESKEVATSGSDPLRPFEIFSLYDHSKYETHTYSNVQQISFVQ